MSGRNEAGQQAATLLATTFVVFLGLLFCTAIIFAFSQQPAIPIAVIVSTFTGVMLLASALRSGDSTHTEEKLGVWQYLTSGRTREKVHIKVAYKRGRRSREFGTNEPPTAESVREIREMNNGWEPKGRTSS